MDNSAYSKIQIDAQHIGESSSQYAYRVLNHNILYMNLLPGQVITDIALTDVLKISRTPIREALFRLRDERLIDIYSKNKTIVSYIDYHLLEESIMIRASIEAAVIKQLCGKLTEDFRSRFEENLKIQQLFVNEYSLGSRYYEFDNEFHHLFFEAAGKSWSWRTLERSCTQLNRVRYINHIHLASEDTERRVIKKLFDDHTRLYSCLTENTPEKVDELIGSHTGRHRIMDKWLTPESELRKYIINFE